RDALVAKGIPLYRTPPQGLVGATAYPPISFHLVSWLGNEHTFTLVGRLISLLSLLATGVFVALIVKRVSGSQLTAIISFLLFGQEPCSYRQGSFRPRPSLLMVVTF